MAEQAGKLLNLSILIYPVKKDGLLDLPLLFPRKGMEQRTLEELVNFQEKRWCSGWRLIITGQEPVPSLPEHRPCIFLYRTQRRSKVLWGFFWKNADQFQDFEYGLLIAMLNEAGVKLQDALPEKQIKSS